MIDPQVEKTELDQSYAAITAAKKAGETSAEGAAMAAHLTPLGNHLSSLFVEAKAYRQSIEERWLKDLRQYKGEYEADVRSRLHPKRSKAYMRLTRTKVRTIDARMIDILFPTNEARNFSFESTPVPELDPATVQDLMSQIKEQAGPGLEVTEDLVEKVVKEESKLRAAAMESKVADQLLEIKYREITRKAIHSGNLYGTGVIKGPIVKKGQSKRWTKVGKEWVILSMNRYTPTCEFVPIWDFYPDMSATSIDDANYVFQRYMMSSHKVLKLANRADFNEKAIKAYIKAHPDGDAVPENHETSLRAITGDNTGSVAESKAGIPQMRKKYEVVEFWGYLSKEDLVKHGVKFSKEQEKRFKKQVEIAANVWMLGDLVIKTQIAPLENLDLPYFLYYYDKDETNIFGEGVAALMRDPQQLCNASVRALLDNAAISAGPIVESNVDLLAEGEDPEDIYPFRVFQRTGVGAEASAPAIRVYNVKSYTAEFLKMLDTFMTLSDEVTTTPRYMWGEASNMGGAGRTATGLSMLMGSANITLKDQIRNYDDGVTKELMKGYYFWNMEFTDDDDIKGDFQINAKGVSSLIAKEVRLENLQAFLGITNNPVDLRYTNRDAILREVVAALDLQELNLIKDKQTVQMENAKQAEEDEKMKSFKMKLEYMKAQSGGHVKGPMSDEASALQGLM